MRAHTVGLGILLLGLAATTVACSDDEPAQGQPDGPRPDRGSPPTADASLDRPCAACDGGCVDLKTDPKNCGACGHDCQGATCVGGKCQPMVVLGNLDTPQNVTSALGIVYATVTGENRLVRIEPTGAALTVKGSTTAPWGLAAGPAGYNGLIGIGEARSGGVASVALVTCSKSSCSNLAPPSTTEQLVRHVDFDGTRDFYWAVEGAGTIRHKDPYTGPIGTLVSGETGVYGLAVHQPTVYFTRREATGRLRKIDTSGANLVDLATNLSSPEGLVTDGTTVWVADTGNDRIAVCATAGCGGSATFFAPAKKPHEVTIDVANVYWTNGLSPNGSVQWCPRAGCPAAGPHTLAEGQANPAGIHVDQTHVYWANASKPGAIMRALKP